MFDQLAQVLIALLLLRWKMSRPTAQSDAPGPSLRPKSPGVWSVGLQVGRWGAQGPGSDETQGLFVTLDMFPVFRMATGWDKLYQAIYIYIYRTSSVASSQSCFLGCSSARFAAVLMNISGQMRGTKSRIPKWQS